MFPLTETGSYQGNKTMDTSSKQKRSNQQTSENGDSELIPNATATSSSQCGI